MYLAGIGVTKDSKKALFWYKKAALQGEVKSQNNLGVMYLRGEGVPRDVEQAKYWYKMAADQGNEEAIRMFTNLKNN
jgi:TPR repeat protein